MNILIKHITLFVVLLSSCAAAYGQDPSQSPQLDEILDRVATRSREYTETFKNLSADETRTFVIYKKNGEEKKRKVVRSLFVVVPLINQPARIVEFRNVISVNGKPVKNGDKRAEELFEKLLRAETAATEIERLTNESSRFDEEFVISGMTLFPSPALDRDMMPYFQFTLAPSPVSQDQTVHTIHYSQVRETPHISVNASQSNSASRSAHIYEVDVDKKVPLNARLNGTLTVDAETFRIVDEIRRLTIQPDGFDQPAVVIEDRFQFQDSPFGINTPRSIVHTQYRVKVKAREVVKEAEISFAYGNFSRPEVEVRSGEVKPQ